MAGGCSPIMHYELFFSLLIVNKLFDVKFSECERVCVRENESEYERAGVCVSRLK